MCLLHKQNADKELIYTVCKHLCIILQAKELAVMTGVALKLIIRGEYIVSVEAGVAKETHMEVSHDIINEYP